MCEWEECKLGDIVTFQRGFDITKKEQIPGIYPVVSSSGVKSYHKSAKVKGPGITIGRKGTLGTVFYLKTDFWPHDTTLWVKDFHGNIPSFIYYFLKEFHFELFDVGSSNPTLNRNHIHLLATSLPPLPEQRAIASVLSSLDDKIDLLHHQNKTLEAMAETLFRQWFVEGADEGWEWVKLGQFIEVMRGLSYKGAGLAEKGNGVPMHNLNSVYEGGGYKHEGIKYYSGDYRERHLVKPGDVIITNTEQGHDLLLIGYPAIVPKHFGDLGIFSQHIYRLRLKDKRITEPFLYYLLMSYGVREQLAGATNGSTVNMLPKDGIEWAKFKIPPDGEIKEFTSVVKPLLGKKESNYSQIRTLEKLRDTLLPKLMSAEVRVSY
jgi:type I restriction enzyme S subunit